ncbi:MAG: right-handed parallel beta-helix repeat-containing protein [Planctomycetes bacterium]|nr:right-handed parallel beta-helix repeat-containing protein [Planctomycetota bacterium]
MTRILGGPRSRTELALAALLGAAALTVTGCTFGPRTKPVRESWRVEPGADACAVLARALARAERDGRTATDFELVFASGVHELAQGLVLGPAASGLALRGEPGARLAGGWVAARAPWSELPAPLAERVPAAAREHVRAWPISADRLARWPNGLAGPVHSGHGVAVTAVHSELFVGGEPRRLARYPNVGFANLTKLVDPGSVPRQAADDVPLAERVFEPPRGGVFTFDEPERLAHWAAEPNLWAGGYWCWDWADETLPVARVDAARRTITLGAPHTYGLSDHARFFVVHALSELDAPGEYWLDLERELVVAWLEPGDAERECALSLTSEPLIALDGASDVEVSDLVFETTRGPALSARAATRLVVTRSTFRGIGTHAVSIDGRDCRVTSCRFEDVGGVGVELSGGERATLEPARNVLADSAFLRTGRNLRTYHPAIRLAGVGQTVEHVEVSGLPHIALLFSGNDHVIAASLFHHVVLETGDAGAIYVGRDWTSQGTVIRGNVFHSIAGSDARYQNAVYLDDMASGITVEQNLFVDCNWGLLVGGGRDDVVRGNTFVSCKKALFFDARGVGWMAKALADPESSTLHRLFASLPVESELWRSRYPHLAAYLTDRFGRPTNGLVEANELVATPLGEIHDRECVVERGTTLLASDELELARVRAWLARATTEPLTLGSRVFGPVGPRLEPGASAP